MGTGQVFTQNFTMSVQKQILEILNKKGSLSADQLVTEMQKKNKNMSSADVKSALLPLMSTHRVLINGKQTVALGKSGRTVDR